jgi:hypothetical protein
LHLSLTLSVKERCKGKAKTKKLRRDQVELTVDPLNFSTFIFVYSDSPKYTQVLMKLCTLEAKGKRSTKKDKTKSTRDEGCGERTIDLF